MKTARFLSVIKMFLFLMFIVNIGIASGLYGFATSDSSFSQEKITRLDNFVNEKLEIARQFAKDGEYSKERYHADIVSVFEKQKEIGLGGRIYSAGLQKIMRAYYGNTPAFFSSELAKIRSEHPEIGVVMAGEVYTVNCKKTLVWLLRQYKRNFLLALILFVLWLMESGDGRFNFRFRNPLAFAFLLAIYPIVLAYVFVVWARVKGRTLMAEAELRRTKQNMFSFLSEDEMGQVWKIVNGGVPLKLWRAVLAERGLPLRHGIAIAIVATIALSLVPKQCDAARNDLGANDGAQVICQSLFPTSLSGTSLYDSGGGDHHHYADLEKTCLRSSLESGRYPDSKG